MQYKNVGASVRLTCIEDMTVIYSIQMSRIHKYYWPRRTNPLLSIPGFWLWADTITIHCIQQFITNIYI